MLVGMLVVVFFGCGIDQGFIILVDDCFLPHTFKDNVIFLYFHSLFLDALSLFVNLFADLSSMDFSFDFGADPNEELFNDECCSLFHHGPSTLSSPILNALTGNDVSHGCGGRSSQCPMQHVLIQLLFGKDSTCVYLHHCGILMPILDFGMHLASTNKGLHFDDLILQNDVMRVTPKAFPIALNGGGDMFFKLNDRVNGKLIKAAPCLLIGNGCLRLPLLNHMISPESLKSACRHVELKKPICCFQNVKNYMIIYNC